MCGVDYCVFSFFITYAEIYGDFTEAYRITIAYIEIEIRIAKQDHVIFGYILQSQLPWTY